MKNVIKVLSLTIALVMLVSTLAACGGVSGTYTNDTTNTTYEFSLFGSKFTKTTKVTILGAVNTTVVEGTYELNDAGNEITITEVDEEGNEKDPYTLAFEEGEDENGNAFIKIGLFTYTKQ